MKLTKKLWVTMAGEKIEMPIVTEDIRLNSNRAGRAIFQIRATATVEELEQCPILFAMSWQYSQELTPFFTGYIERCEIVDAKQRRIFCREVSAKLDVTIPLALRHPTLRNVLTAYADKTGLDFIIPKKAYADTCVAYFGTMGSGVHGIASLKRIFGISDFFWTTQGDGKIYVGSWADTFWPSCPITLPERSHYKSTSTGFTIMAIPTVRVGAVVDGQRITGMKFSGHEMELSCERMTNGGQNG